MELEILKLNHNDIDDFSELVTVFERVFEWENFILPNKFHLQKVLNNRLFLVFVAKTDNKLIGGLTAHILESYDSEKPSAYIYDLAVLTNHQRKGIGKLLIASLSDFCDKNGFKEVFVQAESEDLQAISFYKTTAISSEMKATHFTYLIDNK